MLPLVPPYVCIRSRSCHQFVQCPSYHTTTTTNSNQAAAEVVAQLKEAGGKKKKKADGNAAIYGMAAALPAGPVNDMLRTYMDVVLS